MQASPAALVVMNIGCGIPAARVNFRTHPEVIEQSMQALSSNPAKITSLESFTRSREGT